MISSIGTAMDWNGGTKNVKVVPQEAATFHASEGCSSSRGAEKLSGKIIMGKTLQSVLPRKCRSAGFQPAGRKAVCATLPPCWMAARMTITRKIPTAKILRTQIFADERRHNKSTVISVHLRPKTAAKILFVADPAGSTFQGRCPKARLRKFVFIVKAAARGMAMIS
ncbi:MAG: hypothetical protein ONB48_18965 [candidate division KSB1 bacterium]|nr:hypothetical protein [candidate division KSB1 bacterium]MDZ7276318.1 hypothetical protein [candidate division KSB1 bacterium]MDZ7287729.1 hypothetical protein [candidate division KSB1 bacterium]MDZ7299931.1 hypothetical protein [candidate division KSB1 bacterium]MDZ7305740.1 hypothetical protein [candidate division KSB1 bacterium]